ncbi:uncharacterized protein LOC110452168 [Mizuhopecten yessoensis]|uniref:Zinc finger protein 800 n=1 Tax=Mizuhopecten yessoensis TaxID=6573 RepID=A0A210QK87_MIZYE|nr:uncharacterized protein LOC110452168 [Mizuhopecten yessoensis]OWF49160.1 Zinc finger protein 800 [Mizuhopecten yessoensis]
MSDSSDEEDSISKIDFSVISMAIEAGHKMVQQILNCVHYGTPEVRNLMYNECDFIVECRVCRNLFRSIPNFVAHKRIYCTAEAEQTLFPSSGQEESVVVVQPMDNSPGTSGSVSPTAVATTSSQSTSVARQSATKSANTAIPTGSVNNAKSVLSSVFSSSSLSQSRTMSQSTSSVNVSGSMGARRSAQEQPHNQGQGIKAQGQGEKKEEGDSSDGDTSTLKQLLTGKFKGKSSEYNFYSKTAEKMERERRSKEVSTVVMTPIPTNRNAAYLTVTKSGTATDGQNVIVSPGFLDSRKKSSESVAEPKIVQNWENSVTGDMTIDSELKQRKVPERSSKRKNTDVQKIVNEETATTSRIPEKTMLSKQKQMEQKNKKFVQLRPVKSQLGSHQYSELSELGLLGHCDLALSRCLLCSVSYCSRKGLLQHMHSIHSGRKILFPCSMCEKRFSYFWGLTRHLQNNHNLSKEKIDKIRDKLKSMAFDTAELEQEEHSDPKSRGSLGQNPDGSKQEKPSVKQTSNLVQTVGSSSRIQRDGETTGIKLNKCEGCKRAFWKKSNYDEHINQCKWLVTPSDKIDQSRSTSRSRSESSRGESTSRTTETSPNRPATRSKVTEKDVNIASSNVMDNLEIIERRARSRTRSKIPIVEQAKQQNVSEKDQAGGGTNNKDVAMENDHEDSRDGSEFSKSSSTDRFRHKEKSQDQKSPVSSPSKRSDSSSPNTPSKLQMVTRHSAKSSEKETQYMRTRFYDKRRESQIRPDKSPQSKTGSESDSPTLQTKDGVKVVLAFESECNEKMNKSRECLGSDESEGSGKTMQSISSGKDGRIDEQKLATKSRDSSLEGSNDRSEGSEAVHTRASRDSSRESLKETSLSRPSTRSVEKTVEISKDRTKSQTTPTSKRDGQKSPIEGVSRDSSRESLKDGSSRVSTRSAFTHSATNRSRSRDTVEASPVLAKKDRENSPVGKDVHAKRDSSTENENERSLSRTRSRNVSKSENTSRCSSKESISARISTRHTPSQVSHDNVTKNPGGTEPEQDNKGDLTSFRASVRKSNRASVGMKTDKTDISEKLKEDNVCKGTIEHATSEKTKQGNAREPPDSCQKLGGNTPGVADKESTGISDGNVQRVSTRSGKLDTKTDSTSEKHSGVKESNNLSNKLPSSEPEAEQTEQSDTLQSMVTRRSLSNTPGQKDINKSSNTRSSGLKSSEDVPLKETRSSGTRKTNPSKASGKSKDEHHAKGDHSSLNENEGLELQKRSVRIREKLSAGKDDESDSSSQDSPPSPRKTVDEVDGGSTFRSTRLAMKAQKMKCDATKTTEDVPKPTEVKVSSMIISSLQQAENQNFLGLNVTPYTRKSTSRASSQFTPRIPKCLESDRNSASNTIDTTSDSKFEESTALERSQISDSEDKFSDSDESYDSSIEELNSDFISASPEPEVQLFEEIWVQKEPGLPTEEIKTNAFAMMTYKSSPTQVSSKGPSPSSSGHTTRASERMRTTRTQMYVTDPKNMGTSQESVQTRCLDLSRISYLSDEKEMKCLQCGLGFSCLSNLRRHVVRHLGWRRYKCKLCKFSSYNKSECNTHLIRSHGTKARNCTASTLIIDLNKEASKVRSQKKFNTIKSKTTGPSLRSRSPKKTLSSGSEKTEDLTTETKLPESKKVSRVTSQQEKTRKGDVQKESFAASKTQSSDQSATTVVATRSRTTRKETKMDNIEDSQSTKKGGTANDQSDEDAAANLQMKTEELRRTRKRKRSNSEDTNSSKVEINKGEITVSDTKKSRKRKRSNSLEGCSKEEEAASNKLESLVVPIKKKYEMKRSTSLDGTSSSLPDDVGETLSDSWDIPSVSDFENSDTEMVCSPPIAKVVPNLETMMAALEEARAFKFVRQRGKGRKSLPLVKKTQRSGSLGSQADSNVEISINTAGTSSVEGTPTQSKVLELSGVSSASLNSEGDKGKFVQSKNITCTSREETDEETCAIKVNKISSDASNNEKSCVQNSSTGRKDNSSGEQNNSSGKKDSSSGVKDSSASAMDDSSSNMDDSSSTKVSSSSVKDSSSSVKDSSSSVKDSSPSVKGSSSSVKDSSSSVKDSSSSVKCSSSSAHDSSSSTQVNSPGVQHGSSGVTDSSSTKDCPSDVQDSSMCKQDDLSGIEDSSSSAQISSISTKNTSPSDVTEITTKVSNVETISCSREDEHSTFEKETIENVVDSDKSSKAKEDRCKETVTENSGALHDPSKVVEECVSLGSEPSIAKGDNTSGQKDLGDSDVSMVTKPAIAEDVGTGDADKEKQKIIL